MKELARCLMMTSMLQGMSLPLPWRLASMLTASVGGGQQAFPKGRSVASTPANGHSRLSGATKCPPVPVCDGLPSQSAHFRGKHRPSLPHPFTSETGGTPSLPRAASRLANVSLLRGPEPQDRYRLLPSPGHLPPNPGQFLALSKKTRCSSHTIPCYTLRYREEAPAPVIPGRSPVTLERELQLSLQQGDIPSSRGLSSPRFCRTCTRASLQPTWRLPSINSFLKFWRSFSGLIHLRTEAVMDAYDVTMLFRLVILSRNCSGAPPRQLDRGHLQMQMASAYTLLLHMKYPLLTLKF
jgi:hypothetical protein